MGWQTIAMAGLSMAQNSATQSAAKGKAQAVVREGEIQAANSARKTNLKAASQTVSFLQSGLTLEGTPQNAIKGTYETGLADVNQIIDNTNNASKNIYAEARTAMLANLAKSAAGAGLGGLDIGKAGASAFSGSSAGTLSYLPESWLYNLNNAENSTNVYSALEMQDNGTGGF